MAKDKRKPLLNILLAPVSIVAFLVLAIFIWYGKIELTGRTASIRNKIPKNQAELQQTTETVLGEAVRSATDGGVRKAIEKSGEFFEESDLAAPARGLRDEAKNKLDEMFEKLKALPAAELKIIKRKIYEDWIKKDLE